MRKIFQYIIGSRIAPIFIILIGSFFAFIISVSSPKPQKGIELPKPTPVFYEVINPYQQSPPLAIGMFVDAVIEGKTIKNGFLVPNSAINNNSKIYVINTNDNLEIRKIEVLGTENDYVIIKGEISEGERVVVSPLNNAKDGMALKPILLDKNIVR